MPDASKSRNQNKDLPCLCVVLSAGRRAITSPKGRCRKLFNSCELASIGVHLWIVSRVESGKLLRVTDSRSGPRLCEPQHLRVPRHVEPSTRVLLCEAAASS